MIKLGTQVKSKIHDDLTGSVVYLRDQTTMQLLRLTFMIMRS